MNQLRELVKEAGEIGMGAGELGCVLGGQEDRKRLRGGEEHD